MQKAVLLALTVLVCNAKHLAVHPRGPQRCVDRTAAGTSLQITERSEQELLAGTLQYQHLQRSARPQPGMSSRDRPVAALRAPSCAMGCSTGSDIAQV